MRAHEMKIKNTYCGKQTKGARALNRNNWERDAEKMATIGYPTIT
jgi:hypothetical protein